MDSRGLTSTGHEGRVTLRFGGFSPALLRLEVRRLIRNRRALLGTVVIPVIFFLLFGLNSAYANERVGNGNASAFIMISMALYGAVVSTTSGGAMVSVERALGWSRQLRITPLSPVAYISIKMITSLILGLASVAAVYAAGALTQKPSMPAFTWAITGASVWLGSIVFSAFGLFVGYLLPSENVMQILGFAIMLLSFGGGLFLPLNHFPHALRTLTTYTPLYGINQMVHFPLTGGAFDIAWLANTLAWLALFTAGAAWRFKSDTAR